MSDPFLKLLKDAWELRVLPLIRRDRDELERRLARRRQGMLRRPPRAWCLAVRASDQRVNPATALCQPEDAAYPKSAVGKDVPHRYGRHRVTLTSALLRKICRPVVIPRPGVPVSKLAKMLGCTAPNLAWARTHGVFEHHHVRGLGGYWGRPTPILYTNRPLDPSAPIGRHADVLWGTTWKYLCDHVPADIEQTIERVPMYRPFMSERRRRAASGEGCESAEFLERAQSRSAARLPEAAPDMVWYKWRGEEYVGYDWRHEEKLTRLGYGHLVKRREAWRRRRERASDRARERAAARGSRRASVASGSLTFCGWRWICPGCARAVRVLYYPLPMVYGVKLLRREMRDACADANDVDAMPQPLPGFACARCHDVLYFTRFNADKWNHLIAHLSGGLLYGHEVERPEWFKFERRKAFRPVTTRAPSQRRQMILSAMQSGLTYTEIAARMRISKSTVASHARRLWLQAGVKCKRELMRVSARRDRAALNHSITQ